jgi:hypothetical protein
VRLVGDASDGRLDVCSDSHNRHRPHPTHAGQTPLQRVNNLPGTKHLGPLRKTKGRSERPVGKKIRRRPTLPGGCPPSTIGAGGLNCSVRNGKRCTPAAMTTGTCEGMGDLTHLQNSIATMRCSKSRPRAISTGPLNALLHLHVPPINVVVSHGPYSF